MKVARSHKLGVSPIIVLVVLIVVISAGLTVVSFPRLFTILPQSSGSTTTDMVSTTASSSVTNNSSSTNTFSSNSVSISTDGCASCITFDQSKVGAAVSYFTSRFNSKIGLVTVGTPSDTSQGGVTFYYMDATSQTSQYACAPSLANARVIPNEDLKDAYSWLGMNVQVTTAQTIIQSVTSLYTSDHWHPSWNDESMIGIPIPYAKANNNYCLTPNYSSPTPITINGQSVTIVQALPWNPASEAWISPNMNVGSASNCGAIDECLFQAVNLYIRGCVSASDSVSGCETNYATANLQNIASQCQVNSDGSEQFGTGQSRGMYLGTFLEAYEVINDPSVKLSGGCTIAGIVSTIYCLQQGDGGITMNYNSCASSKTVNDDDETTNAFLLAASPGVILRLQHESSSGQYSPTYVPPDQPDLTW